MVQKRQRGQPQSTVTQPTRQPRLAGRVSPQQSLKRVGPAFSEMLRTSVRTRPRNDASNEPKQQAFRPDSGADAFLYLDKRVESEHRNNAREPDSLTRMHDVVDSRRSSIPTTRIVLPIGGRPDGRQTPSSRAVPPEKRTAATPAQRKGRPPREPASEEPGVRRRDTMRVRLPGLLQRQLSYGRGPHLSKALPSLPANSPSPRKTLFNQARKPSTDAFLNNNKGKVLRGRDSPAIRAANAPPMESIAGNSKSSSSSSYDSAEQTWNMINSMMHAVGEDEVKRARETLGRGDVQRSAENVRAPGGYVTFPRAGRPWRDGAGSLEEYSSPERTGGGSSVNSSPSRSPSRPRTERFRGQEPARPSRSFSRPRSAVLSMRRRASVASVFSIVIQPTRELSHEAQDALIVEDDLPLRIRGILQCTHGKSESVLSNRTSSVSSDGADLHPDLAVTIDALRSVSDVELEDIAFDTKEI